MLALSPAEFERRLCLSNIHLLSLVMPTFFQGVLRVNSTDTPIIPNRQGFFSPRPIREHDPGTPILTQANEILHSIEFQQKKPPVPQSPPSEERSVSPSLPSKVDPPSRGSHTYEVRGDPKRSNVILIVDRSHFGCC